MPKPSGCQSPWDFRHGTFASKTARPPRSLRIGLLKAYGEASWDRAVQLTSHEEKACAHTETQDSGKTSIARVSSGGESDGELRAKRCRVVDVMAGPGCRGEMMVKK